MVSRDQGVRWHSAGRQTIDAKKFDFKTEEDGELWFSFRTVTLSGATRQTGNGPQIRVLVDSVAPKLDLEMQQQESGELLVQWKAEDRHLSDRNLSGRRPDFAVSDRSGVAKEEEKKWTPLNVDGKHFRFTESGADGRFLFWPENDVTELELRAVIADFAGNTAEKTISAKIKPVHRDEATRFQDALKAGVEKPMTPDGKVEVRTSSGPETSPTQTSPTPGQTVRLEPPRPTKMKKEAKKPVAAADTAVTATEVPSEKEPIRESAPPAPETSPTDPLTESLVAEMGRFFEQGLSVEIAPKAEKKPTEPVTQTAPKLPPATPPAPAPSTGKTASAVTPTAPASPEKPAPRHPGKITGISLNTAASQPQIIVKWNPGDAPWRDARIDLFRCADIPEAEMSSPWFPVATNLPNSGEYWWYLSNDDFKPFRILLQIRAPQGSVHFDTTRSAIRIDPKNLGR